jgi:hypothetical protein
MRSINEEYLLNWEDMKKAFYLKCYPQIEAYCDRGYIYNFWPHPEESITQAWGRLKKCLRKNPCHGISKSIILINFYVRLPSFHKDFLDNSSEGSFNNRRTEDAWGLLDLVSENTSNWDLDKGKIITIDYGYDCVKNFYASDVFEQLSSLYSIDSHVLFGVIKYFAKHVALPKEGFIEYVKPMKYPAIMHAGIHASTTSPVLSIKAAETDGFVEVPPFPTKV